MKIWHHKMTRSLRVVWMAEEMGLDYEIIPGELGSRELLAVNPSDTLPAFQDGDVQMSESVAIMQYLAARYGPTPLVPLPDAPNYANYLQYLWFGEASIAAPITTKILNQVFAPDELKGGWIADHTRSALTKRLKLIDRVLDRSPYMAGDDFTAADISVVYGLNNLGFIEMPDLLTPKMAEYRERVMARPALQRALEK